MVGEALQSCDASSCDPGGSDPKRSINRVRPQGRQSGADRGSAPHSWHPAQAVRTTPRQVRVGAKRRAVVVSRPPGLGKMARTVGTSARPQSM